MYISEIEFISIAVLVIFLAWASYHRDNVKRRKISQIYREVDFFYKKKTDEEITRFIVEDAIRIGLYVGKCDSAKEICDSWYYWRNYPRKSGASIEDIEVGAFDLSKKRRDDYTISWPNGFTPVEIDLKSIPNYGDIKS